MDHLPLPSQAVEPALEVPFVSRLPYRYDRLLSSEHIMLSIAQTWLYFGTLSEFFQTSVDPQTFCRISQDGKTMLDSERISALKDHWTQLKVFADDAARRQIASRCTALLIKALFALEEFEKYYLDVPSMPLILATIRILLCSLTIVTRMVTKTMNPSSPLATLISKLTLKPCVRQGQKEPDFIFLDHMVNNGWCPHQVYSILQSYCASTMYYFACMARKRPHIDHQSCYTTKSCVAHTGASRLRHTTSNCSCKVIGITESVLINYLEHDAIPIVSCGRSSTGKLQLELVEAKVNTKYTAVSHVWVDGLGNPEDNAMAECQLERLVSRIQLLRPPEQRQNPRILFWMDTFCIPIAHRGDSPQLDSKRTSLKTKAIGLMTPIYFRAENVLVLDSELDLLKHDALPFAEMTARLTTCGWMGRAWTLQEGSLASKLCFQFGNGVLFAYEGQKVLSQALTITKWNQNFDEQNQMLFECRSAWHLPTVAQHEEDAANCLSIRDVQFLEVWNSLINRSTTMPDDYHDIVANLLDFSVLEIRRLKTERKKMQSMLFSQERLPMDILCLPIDTAIQSLISTDSSPLDSWIVERPTGPMLKKNCFSKALYLDKAISKFIIPPGGGPPWYFINPSTKALKSFCLAPLDSNPFHPHIILDVLCEVPDDSLGLCLFLATTPGHPLLLDAKHSGACFAIEKSHPRKQAFTIRYQCSLRFESCWEDHEHAENIEERNPTIILPAKLGDKKIYISPGKWYKPKIRRPPNAANWGLPHRASASKLINPLVMYLLWLAITLILYVVWLGIDSVAFIDPLFIITSCQVLVVFPFFVNFTLKLIFGRIFWYRSYTQQNALFVAVHTTLLFVITGLEKIKNFATHSRVWRTLARYRPSITLGKQHRWLRNEQDDFQDSHPRISRKGDDVHSNVALSWKDYSFFAVKETAISLTPEEEDENERVYEMLREKDAKFLRTLSVALRRTPD